MGIFKFLYFPTLSAYCEESDGSTYLLCFSVFLLPEMERKREQPVEGKEKRDRN
jgi:hypothetical protein